MAGLMQFQAKLVVMVVQAVAAVQETSVLPMVEPETPLPLLRPKVATAVGERSLLAAAVVVERLLLAQMRLRQMAGLAATAGMEPHLPLAARL